MTAARPANTTLPTRWRLRRRRVRSVCTNRGGQSQHHDAAKCRHQLYSAPVPARAASGNG
eukprot:14674153-Alexandrium_andersonii.AAC.1